MARNQYADDYEIVTTRDETGNEKETLVYRGEYYQFALDGEGIRRLRMTSFLLLFAVAILHVGAGFVNNRGMNQFFVALPYVIAFFPLYRLASGVLRLPKEARLFRRDEMGRSFDRIKTACAALFILLVMIVLGEILYLIFASGSDLPVREFLFLLLEASGLAVVYFLWNSHRQIQITVINETNKQ